MPKKPQDHLPKKTNTDDPELITIEIQGLPLTIDPVTLDDFELLDDLYMVESGNLQSTIRLPSLLRRFLGDAQHRAVMDHLRNADTGRVSIVAGIEFVGGVLAALQDAG